MFTIYRESMGHRSGTKEYHFLLIANSKPDLALLVCRWGKKNAFGSVTVETGTLQEMKHAMVKKRSSKESGGYNTERDNSVDVVDESALCSAVGAQYWTKLGKSNIQYIAPGLNSDDELLKNVRDPEKVEFEENGKGGFKRVIPEPKFFKPEPEETLEDRQNRDPLWGMF